MRDDAVVVGAGPAGSAIALALARAGRAVRIVERARFPRRKACGEYLDAGSVDALDALGLGDAVRAIASPLRGVRLVAGGAPPVALPFPRPVLACARERLDAVLLEAALAAGATLERGRVEDLVRGAGRCAGVLVRDDDGTLHERRAGIVIGADGIGSLVARKLGLVRPSRRRGRYAVGGHYAGIGDLDGHVEMYVGGGAYFALNPLGPDLANVMVVVPRERLARWSADVDAGVAGAAARLGAGVRSFAGAARVGARVAVGPLAHAVRSADAPGAILVGDAAGFLDPFTGQGVAQALRSAQAAAAAIVGGDPSAYARAHAAELARRARLCAAIALLVDVPFLARRAARRLARAPELGAVLLDALAGTLPPQRALRLDVLGRLVL